MTGRRYVYVKSAVRKAKGMQTAKQEVEQLLHNLPEDSTLEDIQYHLYVLEKIKNGRDDIAQGRRCSDEEARLRLKRWLDP